MSRWEAQRVESDRRQLRSTLEARLAEQNRRQREVLGDGHCQFRAVADQLGQTGVQASHEQVRRRSVCWLAGHGNMKRGTVELKDFASLPEHPDGAAFSEYIEKMEATSDVRHGQVYWGDYLTLHAVATVYRCEVVVVSSLLAATEPIIIRPLQGSVREERRVWLAHLHEYRYQSTRPGWPAVQVEQPAHRSHTPRASNLR